MNIGQRIKDFRKINNLGQKELASKLNVSNKTISSWEQNRTQPKMEMIEDMCKVFSCKKSDFLDIEETDYLVPLDNGEKMLIEIYRNSDKHTKEIIYKFINSIKEV